MALMVQSNSGNSTNTKEINEETADVDESAEPIRYNAKVKDTDDIRMEMKRINEVWM